MFDSARSVGLESLHPPCHVCFISNHPAHWRRNVLSFFLAGVERGEACLNLHGFQAGGQMPSLLRMMGVDVSAMQAAGLFCDLPARLLACKPGEFDPRAASDFLVGACERMLTRGAPAVRVLIDMTWGLHAGWVPQCEEVFNQCGLTSLPCLLVCHYDRAFLTASDFRAVQAAHQAPACPQNFLAGRALEPCFHRL